MHVMHSEQRIANYVSTFNLANFLNDNLLSNLRLFHFPMYTNVYIQEQEQHTLYFLVDGQVQCNHYHLNGKLAVIALSNPFTVIGDVEIMSLEKVQSNVIATQDTVMLGIESHFVNLYGANDPRFLRFLIDQLRQKLYATNSLQASHLLPLISRLAIYLLDQPCDTKGEIILPDKESLASLMGSTTRHLNRVLKELIDKGSVSNSYPRIHILDRVALQRLTH